jgi:precorrin-4 methylase
MNFKPGQRVRIKGKHVIGTVEKKLTSLDDVYVVVLDHASAPEEKLVRGADLEVVEADKQKTA